MFHGVGGAAKRSMHGVTACHTLPMTQLMMGKGERALLTLPYT